MGSTEISGKKYHSGGSIC